MPYFSLPLYELAKEAFFEIRKILYDNNYKEHCSLAIIYYDEMLEIIELAYASKIEKLPSSVLLEWTKMIEDLKDFLRK